ncbi:MAG: nitrilase [Gammaproteobacteria bacterium]|nr:nitrilase [Gammaproteobacteria bacterium]
MADRTPGPYLALALQVPTRPVAGLADDREIRGRIAANIAAIGTAITAAGPFLARQHGLPVRLVVLPEYVLTGAPGTGPFREWRQQACVEPQGPEYAALGAIAASATCFLAGNAYEADPLFPGLYFQCSFVIDPAGAVILRYRRLVSLYSPSPVDVWDRYVARYGLDGIYPVVDTDIGRLAAVASEEILYPEIARCHVLRGAEVLVHSTSEMGSPRATGKELARQARAAENLAYVVSANTAGVPGTGLPARSSTGMSKIVDYEGRVVGEAPPGGATVAAHAVIDIAALRACRQRAGAGNLLSRLPLQAFAAAYARESGRRPNELEGTADASRAKLAELQAATIERLARAGRI